MTLDSYSGVSNPPESIVKCQNLPWKEWHVHIKSTSVKHVWPEWEPLGAYIHESSNFQCEWVSVSTFEKSIHYLQPWLTLGNCLVRHNSLRAKCSPGFVFLWGSWIWVILALASYSSQTTSPGENYLLTLFFLEDLEHGSSRVCF